MAERTFTDLEKGLIDGFQQRLPLVARPFQAMADELGVSEDAVIGALRGLTGDGVLSRIGAVVPPHRAGWSTLAALSVPAERLAATAEIVNGFREVNHNYEREHAFNLWFVVTAPDQDSVAETLAAIEKATGCRVLDLPLEQSFHIDLGFAVKWN